MPDEATRALDSGTETDIQKNGARLMACRVTIVSVHRPSTIQTVDRPVIMDGGRIVEPGSHEALVSTQGLYVRLWCWRSGEFMPTGARERS